MTKKSILPLLCLGFSIPLLAASTLPLASSTTMKSRYYNLYYEMWANNYSVFNNQLLEPVLAQTPSVTDVSLCFLEWQLTNGVFNIYSGQNQSQQNINEWLSSQNPAQGGSVDPEYYAWTSAKFAHPGVNFLLSFGGYTFGAMWDQLASANSSEIQQLAISIVNLCTTNYPVYSSWAWYNQQAISQLGSVTLQGVDFDFEPTTGGSSGSVEVVTAAQITALGELIQDIHTLNHNLLITIDGRSASADASSLPSSFGPGSTAPATAGELVPLLSNSNVMSDVTYVTDMGYDSGNTYYDTTGYQQSIKNYASFIGNSKVVAGLSGCSQYGGITDSLTTLQSKATWISSNNYGGASFWTIGPDLMSVDQNMTDYTIGLAGNL